MNSSKTEQDKKNNRNFRTKDSIVRRVGYIVLGIAIIIFSISILIRLNAIFSSNRENILTSSSLLDVVDVSELSTAQFTYNGIAEVYKDKEKKEVTCYIRYNSVVKAGINMEDIRFEVDNEEKIVNVFIPQVTITANIVDTKSISFIPENTNINLSDAIKVCENDAEKEANENAELKKIAKENLESTIRALLIPLLQEQGYTIDWK